MALITMTTLTMATLTMATLTMATLTMATLSIYGCPYCGVTHYAPGQLALVAAQVGHALLVVVTLTVAQHLTNAGRVVVRSIVTSVP